ncbi:MAG: HD domain-containing protein, partial [Oscillospiraceae bacterium]|nr:HD domain-containing protein [Oscillospiraceae bacterium]
MERGAEGIPVQAEEEPGREMERAADREEEDKQSGPERRKTFRDPIYGYIYLEESVVRDIIDTAAFQRLRDIRQTSYAPLYPAALHNRFIHSIGVYYLGQMAFDALVRSAKNQKMRIGTDQHSNMGDLLLEDEWSRCRSLFSLACLLHDVGHAPFSHTGEDYYKEGRSDVNIRIFDDPAYQNAIKARALSANELQNIQADREDGKTYSCHWHLFQLTKDPVFVSSAAEEPAAHEIMSCIVALETFGEFFRDDLERAFVARCITGLTYIREDTRSNIKFEEMNAEEYNIVNRKMLMDCVIQLLHSSVIDVDRLDYIIRDATTIGYQSVSVDYQRLLDGITLVKDSQFTFRLGFHKNAVSVIENAVYAHDNEKKWVQGHPTNLYECYLIQET